MLLILASLAALVGVTWWAGFEATWNALALAGLPAFLVLGVISALFVALPTISWAMLNRAIDHPVPYPTLFKVSLIGMAVNIITPSSYLGGEPVKVFLLGRLTGLPYKQLGGTVLLTKYLEALSFIPFFTAATVITVIFHHETLSSGKLGPAWHALVTLTVILVILSVVLVASLLLGWYPFTVMARGVNRLFKKRFAVLGKVVQVTRDIEEQVNRVVKNNLLLSFKALGMTMLAQLVAFARPVVFFSLGMGIDLDLGDICLIFLASQALLALQISPSGVGLMDVGMLAVLSVMDITSPQVMAFMLCLRFWDLALVGISALLCAEMGVDMLRPKNGPKGSRGPGEDEKGGEPPTE